MQKKEEIKKLLFVESKTKPYIIHKAVKYKKKFQHRKNELNNKRKMDYGLC